MLDQQMLDLLVDGELTDDQERALLFELSRTPDGWQQCALAFLEARCWHRGFAGLQRQLADVSRTVVRKPAARERNVPGWAWTLMLAGVFVLAFGVGSFLPRPGVARPVINSPDPRMCPPQSIWQATPAHDLISCSGNSWCSRRINRSATSHWSTALGKRSKSPFMTGTWMLPRT